MTDTVQRRVLVLDADGATRSMICGVLAPYVAVDACSNIFDALRVLEQCHYGLILVDPQFDEVDGTAFLRQIPVARPDFHGLTLVLTAAPTLTSVIGLPVHAVIRKPLDLLTFPRIITSCIDAVAPAPPYDAGVALRPGRLAGQR